MTHYGEMHMLAAKLSCDSCDQLFEDMYTCNKHKVILIFCSSFA